MVPGKMVLKDDTGDPNRALRRSVEYSHPVMRMMKKEVKKVP